MSFVELVTAVGLLAVAGGGPVFGVQALRGRRTLNRTLPVSEWGGVLLGLVYLAGGAVALLALVLMLVAS